MELRNDGPCQGPCGRKMGSGKAAVFFRGLQERVSSEVKVNCPVLGKVCLFPSFQGLDKRLSRTSQEASVLGCTFHNVLTPQPGLVCQDAGDVEQDTTIQVDVVSRHD